MRENPSDERRASGPGSDAATNALATSATDTDVDTDVDKEMSSLRERERRLIAYARLLDSAVRLPGGFRVGLDGLVGLVPGVGDLVGAGLSGYLVVAAARLGLPRAVVARMVANVAVETVVGAVPIVGDAFDFVFKANERNARLLHEALASRERDAQRSTTASS